MPAVGMLDVLEEAVLNYIFRGTAIAGLPAVDANMYLALFTTAPEEDGTGGVEVTGGSYARRALKRGTTGDVMGVAAQGANDYAESLSTTELSWPQATANWGTIVGVGLFYVNTAGAPQWYYALASAVTINSGETFTINIGDLIARLR